MEVYDLTEYGIEEPVKLYGNLTFFWFGKGLTTIFLFDEHHGNLNQCIDKNIENAKELIGKANVSLVGVESLAGGKSWDPEVQQYSEDYENRKADDFFAKSYKSKTPQFGDELKKNEEVTVSGVECHNMIHLIIEDISLLKYKEVEGHPLNLERSKHFIQTITQLPNPSRGNLILNCGRNHNTHIVDWIKNNDIEEITGIQANYIRINAIY